MTRPPQHGIPRPLPTVENATDVISPGRPVVVGSVTSDDGNAPMTSSSRPPTLRRSLTPAATSTSSPDSAQRSQLPLPSRLYKSRSITNIQSHSDSMAAVVAPPASLFAMRDDQVMDTRTPSPLHRVPSTTSSAEDYKPDLSAEVAMLSTKLVNAINYQTNLDDSLQQARHDLDKARQELARVQNQKQQLDEMIQKGTLVRASDYERRLFEMRSQLALERAARETAEKAKKQTEAELENLTVSLFEEANTMVAAARKETESSERRNAQLRKELDDTELLLASQQEQLQDLKATLEKMERNSEHGSADPREPSVPTTPVHPSLSTFDSLHSPSGADGSSEVPPEHPLHFSQLLQPIMRNDITAYAEFVELMSVGRIYRTHPHSRNGSSHTTASASSQTYLPATNTSSPSLPGAFSFSTSSSPQSSSLQQMGPTLKESKFYKRSLVEDLEPTLRLDLAPGLSFISRRTVMSALLQGNLVVEPFLQQARFYGPLFACALCGEARKNEPYVRKHRFRTSEEDNAQRYPLCDYCLSRIRAAGDFVGFLRIVRDGHWKCDSEEEQKNAWEESTKLRERMFWARLGGGVVPASTVQRKDVRTSTSTATGASFESTRESESEPFDATTPGRTVPVAVVVSGDADAETSNTRKDEGDTPEEDPEVVTPHPEITRRLSAAVARAKSNRQSVSTGNDTPAIDGDDAASQPDQAITPTTTDNGPEHDGLVDSDAVSTSYGDAEEQNDLDSGRRTSSDQDDSVAPVQTTIVDSTEPEPIQTPARTKRPSEGGTSPNPGVSSPPMPSSKQGDRSADSAASGGHSSGVLARVRAMEAKAQAASAAERR